ncbi:MAG: OadG family transporter subunit [Clostridia bacterium]
MDIMEMLQVVLMGVCTVFVILVSIILICKIMSALVGSAVKTAPAAPAPKPVPVQAAPVTSDKGQLIAAIGAAIASDMGTDVSNIKIHSIVKKVN